MKPVLRVQLIEDSILPGAGIIDSNFVETMVSSVTAKNGQIKIELNQEDDTITKDRFTAVLYKAGESKGEVLKLNEFKYINGYEDGTFRPDQIVTKAEALHMLVALVESPETNSNYQVATIDVLQADKDQTSIAKQFFKTEDIKVVPAEDGYYVEFEIANEGMGFIDIISSIELKVGNTYQSLEVIK